MGLGLGKFFRGAQDTVGTLQDSIAKRKERERQALIDAEQAKSTELAQQVAGQTITKNEAQIKADEIERQREAEAVGKLGEYSQFAGTKRLADVNMLPTTEEKQSEFSTSGLSAMQDVGAVEKLGKTLFAESSAEKKGAGGMGLGGWQLRSKEWDAISQLPESEEKEAAKLSYLYKWSPSSGYNASPESIEQAGKRSAETSFAGATAKIGAETAAGGGVNPVKTERASGLRKEYADLPETKSIKTLYTNHSKANNAYKAYKEGKSSPYEVDQSLGYFASKALDPNSVVMPGEFDRFAKGLGVTEGASALATKLISGGLKLTDAQRDAMLNIVNNAFESAKEAGKQQHDYYAELAKNSGVDAENVVGSTKYIYEGKNKTEEKSFESVEDAEKANLPKGTTIIINGRKAVVE
jgi:Spy/CpxP family protein refolding chaperone